MSTTPNTTIRETDRASWATSRSTGSLPTITRAMRARHSFPLRSVRGPDDEADAGMGLIEVMIALTVLLTIFAGVGWLISSSLAAAELAKQRSTAASIVAQTDSIVESGLPGVASGCTSESTTVAENWITAHVGQGVKVYSDQGQGYTNYTVVTSTAAAPVTTPPSRLIAVTVTVSWFGAVPNSTLSLTNQFLVGCQ